MSLPREINLLDEAKLIDNKVHKICCFGSENKEKNPKAEYANKLHQSDIAQRRKMYEEKSIEVDEKDKNMAKYLIQFYNPGVQPNSIADRDLFVRETIRSVQEFSLLYGYGNCAPMADIAFIEAIRRDVPADIVYIRFKNTFDLSIEELNAIVFGSWPKVGCLIISPWSHQEKRIVHWQGDLSSTPELASENYNHVDILFRLQSSAKNERKKYQQMLCDADYEFWLDNPERRKNIARINYHFLSVTTFGFFSLRELACLQPVCKAWDQQINLQEIKKNSFS